MAHAEEKAVAYTFMRLLTEVTPVKTRAFASPGSMKGEYDVRTMQGMSRYLAAKFNMHDDDVMRLLTEFFKALDREVVVHKASFHVNHFGTFICKSRPHPLGNRDFVSVIRRSTGKHGALRYTDMEDPEDGGPSGDPAPVTQRRNYVQGNFNGTPNEGLLTEALEDQLYLDDDERAAVERPKCDVPRAKAKPRKR